MKNYHRLSKFVNPEVKEGDIVFVWSDTAIVPVKPFNKHIVIDQSYPVLTSIDAPISEIPALVIETGITNVVGICALDVHVLLDTKIMIGSSEFYVSSDFLLTEQEIQAKIKAVMEETSEKLDAELDSLAEQIAMDMVNGKPEAFMFVEAIEELLKMAKK